MARFLLIPYFETVRLSEVPGKGLRPENKSSTPYLLIVDDDHAIANNFALILQNAGYAVAVAHDGESAIKIAEAKPPEIVITDFGLPDMNGVELALHLKDLIPYYRLFFVTGLPEETARLLEAKMPGHQFHIFAKPIHPARLLGCVSELLACNQQNVQVGAHQRASVTPLMGQRVILSGWKEISAYLGCGVRTAQRWEACLGLPVLRPGRTNGKGTVIAHIDEIEAWLRRPLRPEQLRQHLRELEIENESLKLQLALALSERSPNKQAARKWEPDVALSLMGSGT